MARAPKNKKARTDWYQEITDKMIEAMEAAIEDGSTWQKSWAGTWQYGLPLRSNGVPFTGINVWMLAIESHKRGYTDPRWYTYNQAMEAIGYKRNPEWHGKADTFKGIRKWLWTGEGEDPHRGVRKGETGTHVVRLSRYPIYHDRNGNRVYAPRSNAADAKKIDWKSKVASGEVYVARYWVDMASYVVFNAEQIDGLSKLSREATDPEYRYLLAESVFAALQVDYDKLEGCDTACYIPSRDRIVMPTPEQFKSLDHYWATAYHELIHWTGHESRLDRGSGASGSPEYAFEELVAEMGSAFMCAHLGLKGDLRHPEYLAHWVKRLRSDKRAVVRAATFAQKAMDFLLAGGKIEAEDEDRGQQVWVSKENTMKPTHKILDILFPPTIPEYVESVYVIGGHPGHRNRFKDGCRTAGRVRGPVGEGHRADRGCPWPAGVVGNGISPTEVTP